MPRVMHEEPTQYDSRKVSKNHGKYALHFCACFFFQWFQFHLNATSCVRSRTCTLVCSVETAPRITVGLDLPKERNAFDPVQRFPNEHRAMSQARETHIFETRMVPVGRRN